MAKKPGGDRLRMRVEINRRVRQMDDDQLRKLHKQLMAEDDDDDEDEDDDDEDDEDQENAEACYLYVLPKSAEQEAVAAMAAIPGAGWQLERCKRRVAILTDVKLVELPRGGRRSVFSSKRAAALSDLWMRQRNTALGGSWLTTEQARRGLFT
jgi:hypothetical protein